MITLFPFTRNLSQTFTFNPVLDGKTYFATVKWNIYGQRYFIQLVDTNGNTVLALPVIGSPDNRSISITAGYFTSELIFRTSQMRFEVSDVPQVYTVTKNASVVARIAVLTGGAGYLSGTFPLTLTGGGGC